MHIVLGAGNLGCSIVEVLMKRNLPVKLFSTTVNNWKYPQSLLPILEVKPEHIWVCVGSDMSIPLKAWDLNIRLPLELMQDANKYTHLHFFSSILIVDKQLSHIKKHMEEIIFEMKRPNTHIYRVSHLYGNYKPQRCLPYRILKNIEKRSEKRIIPTPTDWLANILIDKLQYQFSDRTLYAAIPKDFNTISEIYEIMQDKDVKPEENDYFNKSSVVSALAPSWLDLWKERKKDWEKYKHAENLPGNKPIGTREVSSELLVTENSA